MMYAQTQKKRNDKFNSLCWSKELVKQFVQLPGEALHTGKRCVVFAPRLNWEMPWLVAKLHVVTGDSLIKLDY